MSALHRGSKRAISLTPPLHTFYGWSKPFCFKHGRLAKLAHFMTERSHKFVRRYDQLAVRNLLYLQAELCYLEIEYALVAMRDASEQDQRQYYNRERWHLQASKSRELDSKQW